MQSLNTTSFGKYFKIFVATISALAISSCVLVTDDLVNRKTTKGQEAALLTRQGFSALSKSRINDATLQFLKAYERNGISDAVLSSLASAHIEFGDIEMAKSFIAQLKHQSGIPVRSQLAYANSKIPPQRITSARALYAMGEEILQNRAALLKLQDYDPYKSAAALFAQSYGAFYDAGLYNDAVCALRVAYGLAPTSQKAALLYVHLVSLGRINEAIALVDDPYFKSNREVVGTRDLSEALQKLQDAGAFSVETMHVDGGIFSGVELEALVRLRKLLGGLSAAADVDEAALFVAPPQFLN